MSWESIKRIRGFGLGNPPAAAVSRLTYSLARFSQLTELSTERNDYTLEECGQMDPPLRSMDKLHLCGSDGTQVTQRDQLVVSVARLK